MKKNVLFLTLAGGIVVAVYSCKHDIPALPAPPAANVTVCFQDDVLPIFQSYCAKSNCHDAATQQGGHQLDSYTNIIAHGVIAGDSTNSEFYEVITASDPLHIMPQPPNDPLNAAQVHTIAQWIQEGATNSTNCSGACDSTQFTYSAGIRPILQTHCLGCHTGMALDGGFIPLDTYDAVKEQVTFDKLYPAVTHTGNFPMPKSGDKLNDCKITQLRKWIEAGAPNN